MPLWNFGQPLNGIVQIAYIVEDIHAEMDRFARELKLGPWFLLEHFQFDWLKYRGEDVDIHIDLALAYSGSMMFELIQQRDDKPSVYTETRDARGYGFHHWGVTVPAADYDAVLADHRARGHEIALEASVAVGGRAAYVDVPGLPGMIELIECNDKVEALFTGLQQASVGWDGTAPVRRPG